MSLEWKNNIIYLTFDDGPTPEVTPWVLSLLNKYQSKATFFCLGKNAELYPDIIYQIKKNGHSIGIHGYEHLNGWKTCKKRYLENIHKASQVLPSEIFRPPYGKITPWQWLSLKKQYRIIWWTYLSKDYSSKKNKWYLFKKLLNHSHHQSIIVFHDTPKAFPFLNNYFEQYLQWLNENDFTCLPIK
ncbi:MAG: polysaccharide deacetylase family protein [Bacteroidales bacterium]|nr:polysaccharide deacetylase family protein [Bacteroidales bacterium]